MIEIPPSKNTMVIVIVMIPVRRTRISCTARSSEFVESHASHLISSHFISSPSYHRPHRRSASVITPRAAAPNVTTWTHLAALPLEICLSVCLSVGVRCEIKVPLRSFASRRCRSPMPAGPPPCRPVPIHAMLCHAMPFYLIPRPRHETTSL